MAAQAPHAQLLPGEKRGKVLFVAGFRYHRHKISGGLLVWSCWRRDCRTIIRTNVFAQDEANPNIQIANPNEPTHNHCEDSSMTEHIGIRRDMQEVIGQNPTLPVRRIYDGEVARLHRQGGGDRPTIPNSSSVKSSIERRRRTMMPPLPATLADVQIAGPWAETWLGSRYLQHLDNQAGIAVFATDENLQKLAQCHTVYMDATFRVCPPPYTKQSWETSMALSFPSSTFSWIPKLLLTTNMFSRKSKHVYVRALTHQRWRPGMVITDFEIARQTAVRGEFPATAVRACYFHFTQSLWRKIQDLGLAVAYRQNRRIKEILRKVMALGYLPQALMRVNFTNLENARRTRHLAVQNPSVDDFFRYIRNTYVGQAATFSPDVWNVFNRDMSKRTNNNVEGGFSSSNNSSNSSSSHDVCIHGFTSYSERLKMHNHLSETISSYSL